MKNIEIKQVIDGELAVVIEGIFESDLPFGSANLHLNLDNMLYFQTYKLDEKYDDFTVVRKLIQNDGDKPTYIDGVSENSDFLELYNTYNNFWRVKIPQNTPAINLYFPKFVCNLYFLHGGEYQKFKRILTEKNN